jgi:hypothetical protein
VVRERRNNKEIRMRKEIKAKNTSGNVNLKTSVCFNKDTGTSVFPSPVDRFLEVSCTTLCR